MTDIIIESPDKTDISKFIKELVVNIQEYFINNLDGKHLSRIDSYIDSFEKNIIKSNYSYSKKQPITARDILVGAIQNLTWRKTKNFTYRIFIDPNAVIPNTLTKFETLLNLIDKGTIDLPPYSIWSDTVMYFCKIIPDLYEKFLKERRHVYLFI